MIIVAHWGSLWLVPITKLCFQLPDDLLRRRSGKGAKTGEL